MGVGGDAISVPRADGYGLVEGISLAATTAMQVPVMPNHLELTKNRTVHQRYRHLLRTGFSPEESAALIAVAVGIGRNAEGELPAMSGWLWQEIGRIEFMSYLARSGRLGGAADGAERVAGPSGLGR